MSPRFQVESRPYEQNEQLWDSLLFHDAVQHPFGFPRDQAYMKAYMPEFSFDDLSVMATLDGVPVAGVQATRRTQDSSNIVDFYGRPALLRLNRHYPAEISADAQECLAEHLSSLMEELSSPVLRFLELPERGAVSVFSQNLLAKGYLASSVYEQVIDLTLSDEALHSGIRRRYKNHINWGKKNIEIAVYDRGNISGDVVDEFRNLHVEVAGRETRSQDTWRLQQEQIKAGCAFIVTGRMEGRLVTASLFLCTDRYCYYGVGASIRELFDKPLSHAIMWQGICEAKRRGCAVFDVGELVDLYASGFSEKEKSIAEFKRGFGGSPKLQLLLGCPLHT